MPSDDDSDDSNKEQNCDYDDLYDDICMDDDDASLHEIKEKCFVHIVGQMITIQ